MIRCALVLFLLLSFAAPVTAAAQNACPATIAGLRECVQHGVDTGHITNRGVANSLFAKIDAAQRAANRGQPQVAIAQLQAFIHEVNAQSGKLILAEHATHMMQHAQAVIAALSS
jgi:hypothetical protein